MLTNIQQDPLGDLFLESVTPLVPVTKYWHDQEVNVTSFVKSVTPLVPATKYWHDQGVNVIVATSLLKGKMKR